MEKAASGTERKRSGRSAQRLCMLLGGLASLVVSVILLVLQSRCHTWRERWPQFREQFRTELDASEKLLRETSHEALYKPGAHGKISVGEAWQDVIRQNESVLMGSIRWSGVVGGAGYCRVQWTRIATPMFASMCDCDGAVMPVVIENGSSSMDAWRMVRMVTIDEKRHGVVELIVKKRAGCD